MRHLIFFLAVFSFSIISCYGQIIDHEAKKWVERTLYHMNNENFNRPSIKGTPFYSKKFIQGTIYSKNNRNIQGVELNYNMVEDKFFFKKGKQIYKIENENDIQKIEMDGVAFFNTQFTDSDGKSKDGFLIALAKGDCELYKKIQKEFKEEEKDKGYDSYKRARFEEKDPEYYIKTPQMNVVRSIDELWNKDILKSFLPGKWSKKFMESLFPGEKEKLLKLVEENNIKLTKEKGLIEFVNHYNSLK